MTATVASYCQDTGSTPPCDGLLKSVSMASQICKAGDVETGCEEWLYLCMCLSYAFESILAVFRQAAALNRMTARVICSKDLFRASC